MKAFNLSKHTAVLLVLIVFVALEKDAVVGFIYPAPGVHSIRAKRYPFHSASTSFKATAAPEPSHDSGGNNADKDYNSAQEGTVVKEKKEKKGPKIHPKKIRPRISILQYHDDWVCVNKPAQMSVHRSKNTPQTSFVVSTLLKRQLSRKVWPVHRLDHRTSGCLLFAFDSETCGKLHSSLTNKEDAKKEYIALVRGGWKNLPETILVDQPVTVDDENKKDAQTEFQLLASMETYDKDDGQGGHEYKGACSLVKCRILTGRRHQIRRHAWHIGHPLLGDTEHGDSRVNRWWRQNKGLNRLFLHCLSLDLPPMQTENIVPEINEGQRIQCVAPLPEELSSVLKRQDMKALWTAATEKEPRLTLEPYDERGGTFGRGAKKRKLVDAKNS